MTRTPGFFAKSRASGSASSTTTTPPPTSETRHPRPDAKTSRKRRRGPEPVSQQHKHEGEGKEIPMAFASRGNKVDEAEPLEPGGGWYPDPYGTAARRWYDDVTGWSDRVQEDGAPPDKTGLARTDDAAVRPDHSTRPVGEDGRPVPLSRPIDSKYTANARPVR